LAKKIIIEEARKHPSFVTQYDPTGYVKPETDVAVRVMECGDFSVKLKAYFWVRDKLGGFIMEKEVLESVKKRFDKEGIEIPFPYRTLVYKKDMKKKVRTTVKSKGKKKK